jgi:hypothetical protein
LCVGTDEKIVAQRKSVTSAGGNLHLTLLGYGDAEGTGLTLMAHDDTKNGSCDADIMEKQRVDASTADPVDGVLVLLREAANRRQDGKNATASVIRQAEVKERVLRRMLENSLESEAPVSKPQLKIIK